MKCSKCGAELAEDTRFCSFCGARIDEDIATSGLEEDQIDNSLSQEKEDENIEVNTRSNTYGFPSEKSTATTKKSIADKVKDKGREIWKSLTIFGKVTTVCIVIFALSCLIAFIAGEIFAGVIAIMQIVLVVVAILMKKEIIKTPKKWLQIVALILALLLVIPFCSLFSAKKIEGEKFVWSDIVLNDVIPEPKSLIGQIYNNDDQYLSINISKTSKRQYNNYVNNCKEKGFIVDTKETESSMFNAFDKSGYELSLQYLESEKQLSITLNAPEDLGTLSWSKSGLATLVPVPESEVGRIDNDDEKKFLAYVGDTSLDTFSNYTKACSEMGFSIEVNETEKHFSAQNIDGYRLNVDYRGNNVISIAIDEPEYSVDIKVKCEKNWIFSKYDVDVYIDDSMEGTIAHGTTESYTKIITKGTYILKFVSTEDETVTGEISIEIADNESLEYEIHCSSSGITIDTIVGTKAVEEARVAAEAKAEEEAKATKTEEEAKAAKAAEEEAEAAIHLTVDNCKELATILSMKAESDPSYVNFASKYKGRIIEFDGSIDYLTNHEKDKSRYEMLVSVGDYDADHQIGPTFKFDEIPTYDIDYGNRDYVTAGQNVHIIAEVESFNTNSQLFFLKAIKVSVR